MAEGRRKSFLCEPVEICDPGVGAIVGAKPGLSAFVSECLYFYCGPRVPGQCLSQADPQLVTPDPVTPGRWSGRGGGCDPVTIIRELMAISGERGGADFQL